ncbi:hypothetical protein DF112_16385 [Burkholderia stagnalis]|nr:hypothetical protein DF112_16385 [Burkholderia stagnalis]
MLFSVVADWPPPPSPPQAASITGTSRERANGAMLRIGVFLVRFFGLRGNRDGTDGDGAAATRHVSHQGAQGQASGPGGRGCPADERRPGGRRVKAWHGRRAMRPASGASRARGARRAAGDQRPQ